MSPLLQLLIFLHLLAALVWLGGLFFMAIVGAPVLRRVEPDPVRYELFRALGLRLRWVGWGALVLLLLTGSWILHLRGWLHPEAMGSRAWWGTATGRALAWKLGAVWIMVALALGHDLLEGGASSGTGPSRRLATHLARWSAGVALLLVYWAMRLARGG